MKVAVVYNRDNKGILNVFGMQNKEQYPEETIRIVVQALEKNGHIVELIHADRFVHRRRNTQSDSNARLGIEVVPALLGARTRCTVRRRV